MPGPWAGAETERLVRIQKTTHHKPLTKVGGLTPDLQGSRPSLQIRVLADRGRLSAQQGEPVLDQHPPLRIECFTFLFRPWVLTTQQLQLTLLMLNSLAFGTALLAQPDALISGQGLDETIASPAEQRLVFLQPDPNSSNPRKGDRVLEQLAELDQVQP